MHKHKVFAIRPCRLCGMRFREGDSVTIVPRDMARDILEVLEPGLGAGGPWGWGGYTSEFLKRVSAQITEDGRGRIIYQAPPQ